MDSENKFRIVKKVLEYKGMKIYFIIIDIVSQFETLGLDKR